MSTNGDCTDIVCDMWLRFTLKLSAEDLVHKAVKIRQKWSAMVADVLSGKIVSLLLADPHFKSLYCIGLMNEIKCVHLLRTINFVSGL